ncbi:MAG: phosphate signaling complex protein PhoU [Phycisphaeraceae bacterium]|nr:phosphate signaling complex protein PhoU [Phycisphaeraceae bacterium]MCW5763261.1 phosphate signaling complex protein PhoU [Phycisphaeraceae bacterium]
MAAEAFGQFGTSRDGDSMLQRELLRLRRRLVTEASYAIAMLESSLTALWTGNHEQAADVRRQEDRVDEEEVAIEQECLRLMTLRQPFAHDFRVLTFCLKVNEDVERVADHASSIAKITRRLENSSDIPWPTALRDMGDRVPAMCHNLLRAVLNEDVDAARMLISGDKVIDDLDRKLFEEVREWIERDVSAVQHALLAYRIGRELERVGDLMANIAEDVVYLATGVIVRHSKRRDPAS